MTIYRFDGGVREHAFQLPRCSSTKSNTSSMSSSASSPSAASGSSGDSPDFGITTGYKAFSYPGKMLPSDIRVDQKVLNRPRFCYLCPSLFKSMTSHMLLICIYLLDIKLRMAPNWKLDCSCRSDRSLSLQCLIYIWTTRVLSCYLTTAEIAVIAAMTSTSLYHLLSTRSQSKHPQHYPISYNNNSNKIKLLDKIATDDFCLYCISCHAAMNAALLLSYSCEYNMFMI